MKNRWRLLPRQVLRRQPRTDSEALALKYAGQALQSLATLASFVDLDGRAEPHVPENLKANVMALRDELLAKTDVP